MGIAVVSSVSDRRVYAYRSSEMSQDSNKATRPAESFEEARTI